MMGTRDEDIIRAGSVYWANSDRLEHVRIAENGCRSDASRRSVLGKELDQQRSVCKFFSAGNCQNGKNCRFRHVRSQPPQAAVASGALNPDAAEFVPRGGGGFTRRWYPASDDEGEDDEDEQQEAAEAERAAEVQRASGRERAADKAAKEAEAAEQRRQKALREETEVRRKAAELAEQLRRSVASSTSTATSATANASHGGEVSSAASPPAVVELRVHLGAGKAGEIIGKGGSIIKDLRRRVAPATLEVTRDGGPSRQGQELVVRGSPSGVGAAARLLESRHEIKFPALGSGAEARKAPGTEGRREEASGGRRRQREEAEELSPGRRLAVAAPRPRALGGAEADRPSLQPRRSRAGAERLAARKATAAKQRNKRCPRRQQRQRR
mmetsp:Transcript_41301/g.133993  ORF Transcript_41301/g.133993 Transcript_41301/m.133993 type:complete len:384 (-) Transcript_41301:1098-2249(-)